MNRSYGHRVYYWLSEFTPWEMPRLHRLFNNLLFNIQRMPLTLAGWRTHSLKIVILHKARRDQNPYTVMTLQLDDCLTRRQHAVFSKVVVKKSLNLSRKKEMILTFLHFPRSADDILCQKKTEIIISDSVSDEDKQF